MHISQNIKLNILHELHMSILLFLQSISDINDIFECFLHQIEIENFEHFTSEDLREVCIKYVEKNSDTIEVREHINFTDESPTYVS